jgi:general transcription factor 3C polypeptide 3 (transcription factor C subunit 4)
MVKAFDYLAMTPDLRDRFDWSLQKPSLEKKAQELDHVRQELDPGVLLMYGHMVAVANHSFSALPYYYRALALQPDNVCVNLSIAAMWIQNSMKRQTENRQFGITQGLAYLYRYYDLRVASGKAVHKQKGLGSERASSRRIRGHRGRRGRGGFCRGGCIRIADHLCSVRE